MRQGLGETRVQSNRKPDLKPFIWEEMLPIHSFLHDSVCGSHSTLLRNVMRAVELWLDVNYSPRSLDLVQATYGTLVA